MDPLTFTRYLYPKNDVKQSLLIALLERESKEALFWAYELYYSGFEEDTFAYLVNIYESFYKSENPELETSLFSKGLTVDCLIGSIIMTLCSRNYQICYFLEEYKSIKQPKIVHKPLKFRFAIDFKEADLKDYITVIPEREKTRFYLGRVCLYPIRRQYNTVFETSCDDYANELWYQWLYFASNSPVWLDRIEDFGGQVNDEKKAIDFPNDDLFEAFYEHWGLEPDEQPIELQEKLIGNWSIQLSMENFCEKYGGAGKQGPPPLLVNSIQITTPMKL